MGNRGLDSAGTAADFVPTPRFAIPSHLDAHPLQTGHPELDSRVLVYALDMDGALEFVWPASEMQAEAWMRDSERNADREGSARVEAALRAWEGGNLSALNSLPVAMRGSPFRRQTWAAMRLVAPGHVVSYAELAALAERPGAARAAGAACGSNPNLLAVPCHRIVPAHVVERLRAGEDADVGNYAAGNYADVGNYAAGAAFKRALLEFEGVFG